ncbi:Fc.00g013640.m01.CDS01 [Cosmosporella sp. VM-42]
MASNGNPLKLATDEDLSREDFFSWQSVLPPPSTFKDRSFDIWTTWGMSSSLKERLLASRDNDTTKSPTSSVSCEAPEIITPEIEADECLRDGQATAKAAETTTGESDHSDLENLKPLSGFSIPIPQATLPSSAERTEEESGSFPRESSESTTDDSFGVVFVSAPGDLEDESPSSVIENKLYSIVPISGKGLGAIATTPITRGTRILTEAALIRLNQPCWGVPATPEEQFDDLNEGDKKRVLSLYNFREDKGPLKGIIFTNAIPLHGRYPECGLFIEASRINHACKPNTLHTWDSETDKLVTYAMRDIEEGEEITSSYISGFAPFAYRKRHLKEIFGFDCQCGLCSLSPDERAVSDLRTRKINRIKDKLHDLTLRPAPVPTLKYIRELIALYAEEDIIDDHPRDAYLLAEKVTLQHRDWRRLVVFTTRREGFEVAFGGPAEKSKVMTTESELQRIVSEDWRKTGGKGGGLWPRVEGDGKDFEDWLFQEAKWYAIRNKYPSVHLREQGLESNDTLAEGEWEVVKPQEVRVPRTNW